MLIEAAAELNLDLSKSFMIGDQWRDIGAGINAGCKTILFDNPNYLHSRFIPDFKINSLSELTKIIN